MDCIVTGTRFKPSMARLALGLLALTFTSCARSAMTPAIVTPASQQIYFFAAQRQGLSLFPNPANSYLAAAATFQPGVAVVIRGKAPVFPNTFNGSTIAVPAFGSSPVQLRYWSLCNNGNASPFPVVACAADFQTTLDSSGYYTYVISPEAVRPAELPASITWLTAGSLTVAKLLLLRNMLPAASFTQSIQQAISAGCEVTVSPGVPVPPAQQTSAGICAAAVMGSYYPRAVYCNEQVLFQQGYAACFALAGLTLPAATS